MSASEVADYNNTAFKILFENHPAQIALIALDSTILAVNKSWNEFGRQNGLPADYDPIGKRYLDVCQRSAETGDESARNAFVGILDVIHSQRSTFALVYPCHSPRQKRWYRMWIQRQTPQVPALLVVHNLLHQTDSPQVEFAITPQSLPFQTPN